MLRPRVLLLAVTGGASPRALRAPLLPVFFVPQCFCSVDFLGSRLVPSVKPEWGLWWPPRRAPRHSSPAIPQIHHFPLSPSLIIVVSLKILRMKASSTMHPHTESWSWRSSYLACIQQWLIAILFITPDCLSPCVELSHQHPRHHFFRPHLLSLLMPCSPLLSNCLCVPHHSDT